MVSVDDVRARVAAIYAGHDTPTWPDPHPDRDDVDDDEYSRLTDPERYRIVHVRARAWSQALVDLLGATAGPLPGDERGVLLTSSLPGTLPLLLIEGDWSLRISVVRPDVVVALQPDCGCDACDSGSDDLLEAVDNELSTLIGGPFVALRGRGWHSFWHPPYGGGWSGDEDVVGYDEAMALGRRLAAGEDVALPPGTEAFTGRPWIVS